VELYKLGPKIGVSSPIFFGGGKAKKQNWTKIQHILVNNFGANGNNFTKLVQVVCQETGMKIWVRIFEGPAPSKFPGTQIGAILD